MQAKSPRPFGKAPFAAISSLLVLDVSNDTSSSSRLELTTNEIFQMDHLLFHRALAIWISESGAERSEV